MEKLKKFGHYSKKWIGWPKRDQALQEEEADFSFRTDVRQESFMVTWCIENPGNLPQKKLEYLESPPFSTGFSSEVTWNLRLYPRGRKVDGFVGLFVHKNPADPVASLKCVLSAKLVPFQKQGVRTRTISVEGGAAFPDGTDKFMESVDFSRLKSFHVNYVVDVTYVENEEVFTNVMGRAKSSTMFEDLGELLKTSKFSDVTLQAGDRQFPAHRAILASRSEVFDSMLSHEMKEKKTGVITVEDVDSSVMASLLQYIYTGRVDEFDCQRALALFPAADKYCLDELKKWCVGIMLSGLDAQNVCQVAVLADLHNETRLKTAVNGTFRKFKHQILKSKEWRGLIQQKPQLASDLLQAVCVDFHTSI